MKFLKSYKEIIVPASMLASLIIGAGMFSLPYVVSQSGLLAGFLYLLGFTMLMSLVHLFYGDVVIADKSGSRFVNQSRRYLGMWGFWFGAIAVLIGTTFTLTIYLVLTTSFANLLLPSFTASSAAILFWILGSIAIAAGVKEIAGIDSLLTIFMILLAGTAAFFGLRNGPDSFKNISLWPVAGASLLLLPLGPFLFSLNGRAAIASLKEYFDINHLDVKKLRKAIILGTSLAAVVYLLFIIGIIGITAGSPGRDIVADLSSLPFYVKLIIGGLGVIAILTSYIFLGLELKSILEKDFQLDKSWVLAATVVPPFLIYLSGKHDFINLIGAAGGIFIAIESTLVLLMWEKVKSKKLWLNRIIIAIFIVGAVYEILKRIG